MATDRFDKFTESARKVLQYAQEESQRFNHNYIGTEHLLLGLVREGEGVAARVLHNLGVELNKVRSGVEFIIGRGDRAVVGEIGLTPRAKKVIELSVDEARRLNHHYIGTEHLLLGLVREGEGIAAGVLESLGVSLDKTRGEVIYALNQGQAYTRSRRAGRRGRGHSHTSPHCPTCTCFAPRGRRERTAGAGLRRGRERVEQLGTPFEHLSEAARNAFRDAQDASARRGHRHIGVEHLLLALIAESDGLPALALSDAGLDSGRVKRILRARLHRLRSGLVGEMGLTEGAKRTIEGAMLEFRRLPGDEVGVEHLFLGLLRSDDGQRLIASLGVNAETVSASVERRLKSTGES
jgi:ATP-dependent Clp protease ATP-binding subunit ClpA